MVEVASTIVRGGLREQQLRISNSSFDTTYRSHDYLEISLFSLSVHKCEVTVLCIGSQVKDERQPI